MKKLLLSIAAVAALGLPATATEVTFDFLTNSYGLPAYDVDAQDADYVTVPATITNGNVQIVLNGEIPTKNCWRMWKDGLRAYSKGAPFFTVSTIDGSDVTGVVITVPSSKGAKFALAGSTEPISAWSGSEKEVTFNYISGTPEESVNYALESITVVYGEDFDAPEPPTVTYEEYTVAQALEALATAGDNTIEAKVTGYVSEVTGYNPTYHSLSYTIVDRIGDTEGLSIYSGKGLDGANFSSIADLPVNTKVTVQGTLKNYTNADNEVIPEMAQENIIVSIQYPEGFTPPEMPDAPEGTITVVEALALIADGYNGEATVEGYITYIEEVSEQYGNATYFIADAPTTSKEESLEIYRGKYIDGESFTSEDQLELGAKVVVNGTILDYNGTPEFTTGSKILSYEAAGIEGIEIDLNAPATYYNLQGVKVANPQQGGLYIIRQGGKSVKAIVR
ncbi:MAG: hypothetical protein J1D77_05130 [Muribaculaceae bacterium]|nr:hypothetical protein [Muribaculaceae bacterium]